MVDPTTKTIATILVNVLMETRDAGGATDHQIVEAAASTLVSVISNCRAEENAIGFMPQIQERIYHNWQQRMVDEGVGQVRH